MKSWVFGDNIDTDIIAPGKYLAKPLSELVEHMLESEASLFAREAKRGDVIIAGKNFGCGSSREQAASGLKHLGIQAILAESFARIFFRNCISIGLPSMVCTGLPENFRNGDEVEFSLRKAYIKNLRTDRLFKLNPLPSFMIGLIEGGGIISMLKKKYST